jgi:hypothetical protein
MFARCLVYGDFSPTLDFLDFQLIQFRLLTNNIFCKYSKIDNLVGEGGSKVKVKFTLYILP